MRIQIKRGCPLAPVLQTSSYIFKFKFPFQRSADLIGSAGEEAPLQLAFASAPLYPGDFPFTLGVF